MDKGWESCGGVSRDPTGVRAERRPCEGAAAAAAAVAARDEVGVSAEAGMPGGVRIDVAPAAAAATLPGKLSPGVPTALGGAEGV